jgi:hypothetical protein
MSEGAARPTVHGPSIRDEFGLRNCCGGSPGRACCPGPDPALLALATLNRQHARRLDAVSDDATPDAGPTIRLLTFDI